AGASRPDVGGISRIERSRNRMGTGRRETTCKSCYVRGSRREGNRGLRHTIQRECNRSRGGRRQGIGCDGGGKENLFVDHQRGSRRGGECRLGSGCLNEGCYRGSKAISVNGS